MTELSFEQCKELKELGFPQEGKSTDGWAIDGRPAILTDEFGWIVNSMMDNIEVYYSPTLRELIDACGQAFWMLEHVGSTWWARKFNAKELGDGYATPEEAVFNLYVKLKK